MELPQTQQIQAQPPADDAELKQRESGWSQFFTTLKNDPNVQNALLQFGSGMLAGPQRGQSEASLLANNIQNSIRTLQLSRQQQKEMEATRAQAAIDAQKVRAEVEKTRSETAANNATTGEVARNAEAQRANQLALAEDARTRALAAKTKLPSEVSRIKSEALKNNASAATDFQNADTTRMQTEGDLRQKQNELKFRYDELSSKEKIEFEKAKNDLRAAGKLPSSDIQLINNELAILGVTRETATAEQLEKATNAYKRFVMGKTVGSNLGLAGFAEDSATAGNLMSNVNNALGIDEKVVNPLQSEAEAVAKEKYPNAVVVPNQAGGFDVLVDGELKGTIQ